MAQRRYSHVMGDPVVTALRARGPGRVAVELDGAPWRVVPLEAVYGAGLAVGGTLDRPTARTLGRELRRLGAQAVALRALRARDHTAASLEQRLAARGTAVDGSAGHGRGGAAGRPGRRPAIRVPAGGAACGSRLGRSPDRRRPRAAGRSSRARAARDRGARARGGPGRRRSSRRAARARKRLATSPRGDSRRQRSRTIIANLAADSDRIGELHPTFHLHRAHSENRPFR